MNYQELKLKLRNPLDNFQGLFFAFSKSQFKEGMESIGLTETDKDKIYSIGSGGFLLKTKEKDFNELFDNTNKALKEFLQVPENIKEALIYELKNHEYCINYELEPTLNALGLNEEEIDKDILREACLIAAGREDLCNQ